MPQMDDVLTTVRLRRNQLQWLNDRAIKEGRNRSDLIRYIIDKAIEQNGGGL